MDTNMYSMGVDDPNSLQSRKKNLIQMMMRQQGQALPLFGAGRQTGAGGDFPLAGMPSLTYAPWLAMAAGRNENLSLPSQANAAVDSNVPGGVNPPGPPGGGGPGPPPGVGPPSFVPRLLFGNGGGGMSSDPQANAVSNYGLFQNGLDDVYNLWRSGLNQGMPRH